MNEEMREREAVRRNWRRESMGEGETRKDTKSCYNIFTAIKLNMEKEAAKP